MTEAQQALTRQILARHSKSFALAGRLLPVWCRREAAALYAWCRRCDDAVDLVDPDGRAVEEAAVVRNSAVARLRRELDLVYAGTPQNDPVLAAFQDVVQRHGIPRRYADDLIEGMAMDVGVVRYRTVDELLLYCYRAAGTVGLMMAHVMKVDDQAVLRRAADLGMAMQLTNICRDVAEDERRGRVYLPDDLLAHQGRSSPSEDREATAAAVAALLRVADRFYRSGDVGLRALPFRCAMAIRAARLIYAEIGVVLAGRSYDALSSRAVVSTGRKRWLLAKAVFTTMGITLVGRLGFSHTRSGDPAPMLLPFQPFAALSIAELPGKVAPS